MGKMDLWSSTSLKRLLQLGVIDMSLLIQIRNAFIAVPSQIVLGLIAVHLTLFAGAALTKKGMLSIVRGLTY